jgi:hypothetical protein
MRMRTVRSRRSQWQISAYEVLAGKPQGKRAVGRPRRKKDSIKMDLEETGWMYLAQDMWRELVNMVLTLRVP